MTDKVEKVKTVLPSGLTIEGSPEEISKLLSAMSISTDVLPGYYMSESKGLVRISEMQTDHLKNALLRRYSAWLDSLRDLSSLPLFIVAISEGNVEDRVFVDMMAELVKRSKGDAKLTARKTAKSNKDKASKKA